MIMREKMAYNIYDYLLKVLIYTIPFYLLHLVIPGNVFLNLPISFLGIFVPFILGYLKNLKNISLFQWMIHELRVNDFYEVFHITIGFFILPIIMSIAILIKNSFQFEEVFISLESPFRLISIFFLYFIGSVIEELGWTGFATKNLQKTKGIFYSGVIIGLIWGIWHILPYYAQGRPFVEIVYLVILSVLYRIVMGYLYFFSNNVILTGVSFHTMINFFPHLLVSEEKSYDYITLILLLVFFCMILMYVNYRNFKEDFKVG